MQGEVAALVTDRLLLRAWRPGDREGFAALNADPRVMEWFPATLSRSESDALADSIEQRLTDQGWGLWAVDVPGVAEFIGFVGLNQAEAILGYPVVEVGWRLSAEHWGHGYAPEAATASLEYGFSALGLEEIVAYTTVANAKSRRVMDKIGMTRDDDADFDHPRIAEGSRVRRQVLYRISRAQFERGAG
jgi:3-dehydroquinate dehydratase/shikimate dehydrogenase